MGLFDRLRGRRKARFDRFTPQMRRVLQQSVAEARHFGHNGIGTLHFVAAMARVPDCAAVAMLGAFDITPDAVYAAVEARLGADLGPVPEGPFRGLLPPAKRAIELAVVAARGELAADFVGTQHLLLGILREEADEAAQALAALGVRREAMLWHARLARVETSRRG